MLNILFDQKHRKNDETTETLYVNKIREKTVDKKWQWRQ